MRAIVILAFALISSISFGQKLKFKIANQKDTTVHLIKYWGSKLYYADTAEIKGGYVEFDGSKQKPGILGVLLPGQKFFEFIYNNEEVSLETTSPDFVQTMKVKKSEENKIFIEYIKFIGPKKTEADNLSKDRAKLDKEDAKYKDLSDKIDAINKEVVDYQKNLVNTYKGMLVSKIVKMSMDVEIPESPKDANGVVLDSNFRFNYFRKHYWDNIDMNDDALVNTPVFHNKLEYYFGKNMMIQHWDTVLYYAYDLCDRLNPKSKTFEYCVSWITSTYGKSNIMGMDKVYIFMADKYYCSKNAEGKSPAFWMTPDKLEELCEKIPVQKNLVMGVKPPNLILRDTTDRVWRDFYSLKSEYTILYFWDPECGHCKKITPKMEQLYSQKLKARNIEVFAVGKAVGEDFEKWKKYIYQNNLSFINVAVTDPLFKAAMEDARQFVPKYTTIESLNYQTTYDIFSTPRVFVLDEDKKIIAKSISISQLEDLLDKLQGYENVPKLFPPMSEEEEKMDGIDTPKEINPHEPIISRTNTELKKEMESILASEVKGEHFISPEVKLDVNARTEEVYINGTKETNIKIEYLYEVVKLEAANKTDDFPAGAYKIDQSNAALMTLKFIKNTLEGKLNEYIVPGRQITIKISGSTDATPLSSGLKYLGEYGEIIYEPFILNGDLVAANLRKNSLISTNSNLGYLRTMGVRSYIESNIPILDNADVTYEHSVKVIEKYGSNHRRISVEIIIHNAFEKPKPISQIKKDNSNLTDLFLRTKSATFQIEISGMNNTSAGSGFFISSDGIAVSNFHVFEGNFLKTARLKLDDGNIMEIESVLEQNPDLDYIIFKVKNPNKINFPKLDISFSSPKIGEDVFTIGNPEGWEKTLSNGIISGYRFSNTYLQTTTPISHGSSGGALMNFKGEVVGITSGTFKQIEPVYNLDGEIIGYTDNGGDGSLFRAINIQLLNLERFAK